MARRERLPSWGPGKAFQSIGPIKDRAALRRLVKALRIHGGQRSKDMADFAHRYSDAVLARPKMQQEMLGHLPADLRFQVTGKSNPRRRRRSVRAKSMRAQITRSRRRRRNPPLHFVDTLAPNQTVVSHGTVTAFISYRTPVAIIIHGGGPTSVWVTDKFHSRTTSKHINAWLRGRGIDPKVAQPLPQSEIEKALTRGKLQFSVRTARRLIDNPSLAVVGALNPRGARLLGYVTGDLKYRRTTGKYPGWYKHHFKTRARLLAMPDYSLRIVG